MFPVHLLYSLVVPPSPWHRFTSRVPRRVHSVVANQDVWLRSFLVSGDTSVSETTNFSSSLDLKLHFIGVKNLITKIHKKCCDIPSVFCVGIYPNSGDQVPHTKDLKKLSYQNGRNIDEWWIKHIRSYCILQSRWVHFK